MNKFIALTLCLIFTFSSCSQLNKKSDYQNSIRSLSHNNIEEALQSLPTGEGKNFISTMERTYLNLLQGKAKIERLREISRNIDNQIKYKITRGVKSFFFAETPDGYFASEHEIIWMHYLLCWGYSLQGKSVEARVEAKKGSTLLGQDFTTKGRFDDPFMRILSSLMWMFCDEWDEAKVDLRRALKLNPKLKWIKALLRYNKMPNNLIFVLGGTGYEPKWTTKKNKFIRGFRDISFYGKGSKSPLFYVNNHSNSKLNISPDSSYWYKRHRKRNSKLSNIIDDTKYAEKFGYSGTKAAGHVALAVAGGLSIFTLGLGIGGGILYLGLLGESGELAGTGVAIMLLGGKKGYDFTASNINNAGDNYRSEMDPSVSYRYVRFLPEYAWMGWTARRLNAINFISRERELNLKYSTVNVNEKKIFIAYYGD